MKILIESFDQNIDDDIILCECDDIIIRKEFDFHTITFVNVIFNYSEMSKETLYQARFNFSYNYFISFVFSNDMNVEVSRLYTTCRTQVVSDSYLKPYLTRFRIDLVKSWSEDKQIYKWENLSTIWKQRIWLDCSLNYFGISECITNPTSTIIINCNIISSQEDFYAYMGEAFFGYAKYLGKGIPSFKDCMGFIKNKEEYIVVFKKFNRLKSILNTENYPTCSDDILYSLQISNIRYVIE